MSNRINLTSDKIVLNNLSIQDHIKSALQFRTGVYSAVLNFGIEATLCGVLLKGGKSFIHGNIHLNITDI